MHTDNWKENVIEEVFWKFSAYLYDCMIGYLSPLIFLYDIGYYNDTGHEQVKFIYHNLILFEIKLSFLVHPDKNRDDSDRAQKAFEGILYCSVVSWEMTLLLIIKFTILNFTKRLWFSLKSFP